MATESNPKALLPSELDDAQTQREAAAAAFITYQLGDTLKGGRHRPFRKIGKGQFSSVWLALDLEEKQYVAIKAGLLSRQGADTRDICYEGAQGTPISDRPGKTHLVEPLDGFFQNGLNGSHTCLVTKSLGR